MQDMEDMIFSWVKSVKEVKEDGPGSFTLGFTNGEQLKAGVVIWAISKPEPVTKFLPSEVLDEEGYVKVSAEYVPWLQIAMTSSNSVQTQFPGIAKPRTSFCNWRYYSATRHQAM